MPQQQIPKEIIDELSFVFEAFYTRSTIRLIADRYNFANKLDIFSTIVEETLYGKRPIAELSKSLVNEVGVSEEVAQYIEIELDQEIFSQRRLEFNVVQGFVSPDEIELVTDEEEAVEGAQSEVPQSVPLSPQKTTSDPVAGSILGENRRPGAQSDPYREPIDEE